MWLLYFEGTDWIIHTTEGPFGVWRKRYTKGQVRAPFSPRFHSNLTLWCESIAASPVRGLQAVNFTVTPGP